MMFAAGVAWEQAMGADWRIHASGDLAELRSWGVRTRLAVDALAVAAGAILTARARAHARVTRALVERDLTGKDLSHLIHGGRLHAE